MQDGSSEAVNRIVCGETTMSLVREKDKSVWPGVVGYFELTSSLQK